jgi:hypothetical protein
MLNLARKKKGMGEESVLRDLSTLWGNRMATEGGRPREEEEVR